MDGDMEEMMIEGVEDILNRLPRHPRAVLLYTSCVHHFIGCDLNSCIPEIEGEVPGCGFHRLLYESHHAQEQDDPWTLRCECNCTV